MSLCRLLFLSHTPSQQTWTNLNLIMKTKRKADPKKKPAPAKKGKAKARDNKPITLIEQLVQEIQSLKTLSEVASRNPTSLSLAQIAKVEEQKVRKRVREWSATTPASTPRREMITVEQRKATRSLHDARGGGFEDLNMDEVDEAAKVFEYAFIKRHEPDKPAAWKPHSYYVIGDRDDDFLWRNSARLGLSEKAEPLRENVIEDNNKNNIDDDNLPIFPEDIQDGSTRSCSEVASQERKIEDET
ncbi:hypothetical protein CC80DRAFT_571294 [Byssothecium circinans]|uniref:Uncharacterized protein n=1 Tax=Byssothecium circinans TaxID=147558 RepID=A0A6A5TL35_9PLEO|nr:hypothetical protein CC80DRAFT_571294 [Byssothecium circinans]